VIISFILVALYTFFSGIKGPTYTAIIKDILVWVMMLFMVVSLPLIHFNGWTPMIDTLVKEAPHMLTIPSDGPRGIALVYHSIDRFRVCHFSCGPMRRQVFSRRTARMQLRKNSMFLPLYNIVLILVIFLGFIAFLVLPKIH
jgi:SSS family solute:Na+ symporter